MRSSERARERMGGRREESGSALLLTLIFMGLLTAVGTGLVSLANTERLAARNHRVLLAMRYAAEAMAARAVAEASREADWSSLLCCGRQSSFLDTSSHPVMPSGGVVDLAAETQALQLQMNGEWNAGPDTPQWHLYAAGRFSALTGMPGLGEDAYLLGWAADDPAETDHDPSQDSNGLLVIRAEALGFGGVRRRVQVVLKRTSDDSSETEAAGAGAQTMEPGEGGELVQILPEPSGEGAGGLGMRTRILTWRNVE